MSALLATVGGLKDYHPSSAVALHSMAQEAAAKLRFEGRRMVDMKYHESHSEDFICRMEGYRGYWYIPFQVNARMDKWPKAM